LLSLILEVLHFDQDDSISVFFNSQLIVRVNIVHTLYSRKAFMTAGRRLVIAECGLGGRSRYLRAPAGWGSTESRLRAA
jgi:hypothetical protein